MKKSLTIALLAFAFLAPQLVISQTTSEGNFVSSCITLNSLITYGSTDTATQGQVSILQDFLIDKGLLVTAGGGPTGYYGMRTVTAVKTYQASKGIIQTGSVGPLTRAAIATDTGCGTAGASAPTTAAAGTSSSSSSSNSSASSVSSNSPAATTAIKKSYSVFAGGNLSSSGVSTKEEALTRCAASKTANPNVSIWCFWDNKEIYYYYPSTTSANTSSTVTGSSAFTTGPTSSNSPAGNGSTSFTAGPVSNTSSTGSSVSQTPKVGVSNSENGPFSATAKNSGTVYIEFTGLTFSSEPKWCISARTSTACTTSSNGYSSFTNTQWKNDSRAVITANGATFASGAYIDAYISRSGQAGSKVGSFSLWAVDPATYTGAVVGAGAQGILGNQPVTYAWYAWTGPYTLWQWAGNLGFPEPTVACTASNVGATYYLGKGQDNRDIVATCYASNQQMTAAFATVTATTLNQPGGASTTTTTTTTTNVCTPSGGTFVDGSQTVEYTCPCSGSPSGTGWVAQGNGCYHRVQSTTTTTPAPTNLCSWTTGVATDGTFNWACGSGSCTGAPEGSGWVNQNNGCYHQLISNTSSTGGSGGSTGGSGYDPYGNGGNSY